MLAPVLVTLNRTADKSRRERDQEIFRIEFAAHAEAAADVVFDHADGVVREPELLRQDAAIGKRHLGGAEQGQPSVLPLRHEAARLHWQCGMALHLELLAAC